MSTSAGTDPSASMQPPDAFIKALAAQGGSSHTYVPNAVPSGTGTQGLVSLGIAAQYGSPVQVQETR